MEQLRSDVAIEIQCTDHDHSKIGSLHLRSEFTLHAWRQVPTPAAARAQLI